MLVTRGAAAEQSQNLGTHVPELVPLPWQDRNRISGNDIADFLINANPSHPMRDVINLLRLGMKVLLCARARRQPRLRQTLIADRRIPMRQQLTSLRSVLRDKWRHIPKVFHIHDPIHATLSLETHCVSSETPLSFDALPHLPRRMGIFPRLDSGAKRSIVSRSLL